MVAPTVLSECHNLQERESITVYNPCKKSAGALYRPSAPLAIYTVLSDKGSQPWWMFPHAATDSLWCGLLLYAGQWEYTWTKPYMSLTSCACTKSVIDPIWLCNLHLRPFSLVAISEACKQWSLQGCNFAIYDPGWCVFMIHFEAQGKISHGILKAPGYDTCFVKGDHMCTYKDRNT